MKAKPEFIKWKSVSDCVTDLPISRLTREDLKMTWLTLSWNKLGRPVPGWRSSGWSAYQLHKVWSLHLKHLIADGYVCNPFFACRTCRRKQTIKFIQNCWIKKSENILQLYYFLLHYVASSADLNSFPQYTEIKDQGHPNLSANILKIMYAENQTKWLLRNIYRPS